jgi:hypothetical protein
MGEFIFMQFYMISCGWNILEYNDPVIAYKVRDFAPHPYPQVFKQK